MHHLLEQPDVLLKLLISAADAVHKQHYIVYWFPKLKLTRRIVGQSTSTRDGSSLIQMTLRFDEAT